MEKAVKLISDYKLLLTEERKTLTSQDEHLLATYLLNDIYDIVEVLETLNWEISEPFGSPYEGGPSNHIQSLLIAIKYLEKSPKIYVEEVIDKTKNSLTSMIKSFYLFAIKREAISRALEMYNKEIVVLKAFLE